MDIKYFKEIKEELISTLKAHPDVKDISPDNNSVYIILKDNSNIENTEQICLTFPKNYNNPKFTIETRRRLENPLELEAVIMGI